MGKMHELLAVEATTVANYQRDLDETLKTLGKAELFTRTITQKHFFDANDAKLNTTETKEMTTTVAQRLSWFRRHAEKFIDVQFQKDKTNQLATADLVIDGTIIAEKLPATTLLMLESKLQDVRKVLDSAPTLQAGVPWKYDENERLFTTAEPKRSFQTKKVMKPVVMYEATKEHPAQVKESTEDVPVAEITQIMYSGMLTSATKADLLTRLDTLLQACKTARQRANNTEAVKDKVANRLLDYLFAPIAIGTKPSGGGTGV